MNSFLIPKRLHYTFFSSNKMTKKRGKWSEESLRAAMTAIKKGKLSSNAAAAMYDIPRRTLRNHLLSGSTKKKMGRAPVMTRDQENEFVKEILSYENNGTPVTSKLIRKQAFIFCKKLKIKHNFNEQDEIAGRRWLQLFLSRHPEFQRLN
ncbi:hypothetical protein ABMA27_001317 [Loxostege sticticalis]|uniref:HTH CENPB-type domain-containing protein n=1 Tax=Loxostege sticticalis TaxID=481309 RepID=A0ABR3HY27_LOXSC